MAPTLQVQGILVFSCNFIQNSLRLNFFRSAFTEACLPLLSSLNDAV